jgi:signal transduction histidine kinase
VTVAVVHRAGDVQVTVSDDGGGFRFRGTLDHDSLAAQNVGPVTLRERVAAMGGRLQIDSSLTGSRVEFSIPLQPRDS